MSHQGPRADGVNVFPYTGVPTRDLRSDHENESDCPI